MDSILNILVGGISTSFLFIILALLLYLLFLILVVTIICSIVSKYVVSSVKEILDHKAYIQNKTTQVEENSASDDDEDYLNYE